MIEHSLRERICSKCGEGKPRTEFYAHPKGRDGLLHKCKTCHCNDVTTNRAAKIDKFRAYDRERYRLSPERQQQMRRLLDSRDMRRARANQALSNAIRDKRVIRSESCWHCGSTERIEGHHVSYDMPLDVVWLCRSCHCKIHRNHALLNG